MMLEQCGRSITDASAIFPFPADEVLKVENVTLSDLNIPPILAQHVENPSGK